LFNSYGPLSLGEKRVNICVSVQYLKLPFTQPFRGGGGGGGGIGGGIAYLNDPESYG